MSAVVTWFEEHFSWLHLPSITVTLTDVVEILILGFIIYKLLKWIMTSHAFSLLRGILVIVVAVSLIYLLQMDTLIYIINQGMSLVILTAVVIFQPELRKALESLGERQLLNFNFGPRAQIAQLFSDRTLNELVKGSVEMAKVKTGALIVIEQNESLHDYERTGIEVDAIVTSQLLINIFEKNTPLHDGAVIVRGDRVTSATCYLPLSDNMSISKALGTRHRAGLGASEATDSLTIIVSEETGAISLAYKGKLTRNVNEKTLRDRLTQFQNKSELKRKPLWKKAKEESEEC